MLTGQPNTTFTSGFTWPNQGKPTKKEWAQWHQRLQLAITIDNLGRFQQSLGRWRLPWNTHPHRWHWLLVEHPPRLYHWDQEWQVHLPLNTRATRQLKFNKQHTRALLNRPADALRVTCTMERTHTSLSGWQVNIEIAPSQPQTWEEHLLNLPPDKKWALSHLTLLDNGAPLGEAICSSQA